MEPKNWPFRPQHITNDGETEKGDLRLLIGEGIISNEYLRGIQTSICAELENPTTIIEFAPDGTCVRTDSQLLVYSLHAACRCFRDKTQCKLCYYSDEQYARLFFGLKRSEITEMFNQRVEKSEYIQQRLQDKNLVFELQKKYDRYFLEYDCPILGYRELLFPIFANDQVIAVFFVGELCLEGQELAIAKRQGNFFQNPPDWVEKVDQDCDADCWQETRQSTLDAHQEWTENQKNILTPPMYVELIRKTCKQLKSFEKKLDDEMELHRLRYVRAHIEKINREFKRKLADQPPPDMDRHKWLWDIVKTQLDAIRKDFTFQHLMILAARQPMERDVNRLEPVAYAGKISTEVCDDAAKLYLDVKQKVDGKTKINNDGLNDQLPGQILGLKKPLNASLNRCYWLQTPVFLDQVPENANRSAVVWIAYTPENPVDSVENKESESLDIALRSFFDLISTTYSSILAGLVFNNLESTLRIFGHEAGQLTAGLDWLRLLYLKDANRLRRLSDQKAEDLSRDIMGYISQLFCLTQSTSFIDKKIEANKQLFWPYKEILFKWHDTYRLEARTKGLKFIIHHPNPEDPLRPQIYGDQKLLEQLVYNLVNNAVKYCYRGTNIYIDAQKYDSSRSSPYLISVIDFGFEVDEGEAPYGLYSRGKNVPKQNGMGIGLAIARKIVQAHGGRIWHTCSKISDYNVPLIQPYLNLPPIPGDNQKGLTALLKAEVAKLKGSGKYNHVVALDENANEIYKPTFGEIVDAMEKSIFKVSFFVEIPSWEVRK